jgi:hypothetical protein
MKTTRLRLFEEALFQILETVNNCSSIEDRIKATSDVWNTCIAVLRQGDEICQERLLRTINGS